MMNERLKQIWPHIGFHVGLVGYVLYWVSYHANEIGIFVRYQRTWADYGVHETRLLILAVCAAPMAFAASKPTEYLSPLVVGAGLLTLLSTIRLFIVPGVPDFWVWSAKAPVYYGPFAALAVYLGLVGLGTVALRKGRPHSLAVVGGPLLLVLPFIQQRLAFGNDYLLTVSQSPLEVGLTCLVFGAAFAVVLVRLIWPTQAVQAENTRQVG